MRPISRLLLITIFCTATTYAIAATGDLSTLSSNCKTAVALYATQKGLNITDSASIISALKSDPIALSQTVKTCRAPTAQKTSTSCCKCIDDGCGGWCFITCGCKGAPCPSS